MNNLINLQIVDMYGTPVVSWGERFVIELRGLEHSFDFINPKDRGTKYGEQHLKGDGSDIIILNGVSKKQEIELNKYLYFFTKKTGKDYNTMNYDEVVEFLQWLENNNFDDRYCSDIKHKELSYRYIYGCKYEKLGHECKAVQLLKGMVYMDDIKSQEATRDGALFVVDNRGYGHITNEPGYYRTINDGEKIINYKDAMAKYIMYTLYKKNNCI